MCLNLRCALKWNTLNIIFLKSGIAVLFIVMHTGNNLVLSNQ